MRNDTMRIRRGLFLLLVLALPTYSGEAIACGWDDETIPAEQGTLACMYDAVLGTFAKHTPAYYQARLDAADAMLNYDPNYRRALDMKAIAALKLRRFDVAEMVMKRRLEVYPTEYASQANLGTLFTFTGKWDEALKYVDAAMKIEPKAHFGREKYHRMLVEYLRNLSSTPALAKENFLRVHVTDELRFSGAKDKFAQLGLEDDVFDALVAMITVYGADDVPHVYFALGDLLAARGDQQLAWVAYQRAVELKHGEAASIRQWQKTLATGLRTKQLARANQMARGRGQPEEPSPARGTIEDAYKSLRQAPGMGTDVEVSRAAANAARYRTWETKAVASGLTVWTPAGVDAVYKKMEALVPRCKSPSVVNDQPAGKP
jgi:tetratricopeptide (TPR) repeat protein